MQKLIRNITVLIVVLSLASCKSRKITDNSVDYLPARSITKKNLEAGFSRATVKASMQIKYRGKDELPNINGSLRLVKDSIIWLNFSKLGFPIAKLIITPQQVKFYEKIGRTSFEGDFKLISSWLGTDFDFVKVQNLFLGETLMNLESQKLQVTIKDGKYELLSKKRNPIFDIKYSIDPNHFKVVKEEITHVGKNQNLSILYKDFNKINESLFPKGFLITAKAEDMTTIIDINYKNVQFDVPLKFPFKIPAGYRNIELE
jgi:hypothetical protein